MPSVLDFIVVFDIILIEFLLEVIENRMYYISRKDLIRKIKIIDNLILKDLEESDIELSHGKETRNDDLFLKEKGYTITTDERRQLINDCILKSFGFSNPLEYSQKTKFLIDINSMKKYQNLEYTNLKNVFLTLKEHLMILFCLNKPEQFTFYSVFNEEIKEKERSLRSVSLYPSSSSTAVLHNLISYTNQKTLSGERPHGDFLITGNDFDREKFTIFLNNFLQVFSLNYEKNSEQIIDYVIKQFRTKHPFINCNFLRKMTHSTMGFFVKEQFLSLGNEERKTLIDILEDSDLWCLKSLFCEYNNDPFNTELNQFIHLFNQCFIIDNSYSLTEENILNFGRFFIENME